MFAFSKISSPCVLLVTAFHLVTADRGKDCVDSTDVGNFFVNFCEEKCVCEETQQGRYSHVCYREREEFTCMSSERRERFLATYKAVTTPGHPQYNEMQEAIALHEEKFFDGIHDPQYFLPWHRYFLMVVENILRSEDCRVTLPWWRWSRTSATWWTGTPFSANATWLGTDGNPPSYCVTDGAFGAWSPPGLTSCLRRRFVTLPMPTGTQIATVLSTPSTAYRTFTNNLEGLIHNTPHNLIGGHMRTLASPSAPEFFLHHGYIDQLWDRWQRMSIEHLNAYHEFPMNHDMASVDFAHGPTPSNVQDHFNLKTSGVIYVNTKSDPVGAGNSSGVPDCLSVQALQATYSIVDIEEGLTWMAGNNSLSAVPQLPYEKKSFKKFKKEFRWWFASAPSKAKKKLSRKLKKILKAQNEANKELKKPRRKFSQRVSQQLGYDVTAVIKAAKVCPEGFVWHMGSAKCVEQHETIDETIVSKKSNN